MLSSFAFTKIVIMITLFQNYNEGKILPRHIDNRTSCFYSILTKTFGSTSIGFINLKSRMSPENLVVIMDKYYSKLTIHNIVISNMVNIKKYIKHFGYDKKILIITSNITNVSCKILLLDSWFKYRTQIAFAIFNGNTVDIFSNINLKMYNFCPNMGYVEHTNVCSNLSNSLHKKISSKKYCILKVSYVKVHPFVNDVREMSNGGIMVSWMRTFGEIRSIEMDFVKDNSIYQNEFLNNGTFHKLISDLQKHNHDVAIGHLFMNSSDATPVEFGPVIYMDGLGFIHRKLQTVSEYKKMIMVFDRKVWGYFVLTFCIIIPIYYFLNCILEKNLLLPSVVMIDIIRLFLGSSIPIIPNSSCLRIVFAVICIFAITMNTTYLSKLSEIFTNPPRDLEEDIWDHGVRVHISWIIERLTIISYYVNKRDDQRQQKNAGNSIQNKTVQELLRMVCILYVLACENQTLSKKLNRPRINIAVVLV